MTAERIAELRNKLFIIQGNAELITEDERAHPIVACKARTISRTVEQIVKLLTDDETDKK